MKKLILLTLILVPVFGKAKSTKIVCPLKGYQLVWSDEFNASAIDNTKWTYQEARAVG